MGFRDKLEKWREVCKSLWKHRENTVPLILETFVLTGVWTLLYQKMAAEGWADVTCRLFALLGGYAFAYFIGTQVVGPTVTEAWKKIPDKRPGPSAFARVVGFLETFLYISCLAISKEEFIGLWLALKVAGGWPEFSKSGRPIFSIFLIGAALSLAYAGVGWIFGDILLSKSYFGYAVIIPILLVVASGVIRAIIKTEQDAENMCLNVEQLITWNVQRYNEQYPGDNNVEQCYVECVTEMGQRDLAQIQVGDIEEIVRRFLYEWGGMGQARGQQEHPGWEQELCQVINANSATLDGFRQHDLGGQNLGLNQHAENIQLLYGSFRQCVGPTAATKTLHLICPRVFPMWDTGIREGLRRALGISTQANAQDYYRFVEASRHFILAHHDLFVELEGPGRSKVKILDECLFWETQRPLDPYFGNIG